NLSPLTRFSEPLNTFKYRLPTEIEWQFAAHGMENWSFSGSDTLDQVGWYKMNSFSHPHPVKTKKANKFGLYDMSGNVSEWCFKWQKSSSSDYDPESATIRGGAWNSKPDDCKITKRNTTRSYELGRDNIGFRVVKSK
ncbi:MAG: formylglycine-generating enzyme family protein, partial [Thermoanaerobaculia bacterium]|nr:formylglycine-generating enzyme family protein [Thermoanaerobaculia bacterium]